MSAVDTSALRRARYKLLAILSMPLLAIGAAYLVFYTGIGIPTATTNRGALVQPPQQLGGLRLSRPGGASLDAGDFAGRWLIIIPGAEPCAELCRERLWLTRQVRSALGKDAGRVQRLYLDLGFGLDSATTDMLTSQHSDLRLAEASRGEWMALLSDSSLELRPGDVFLVDQRGFVMMRYGVTHEGQDLLQDLRFLLKYSPE